jgi:hypothetical protein
MMNTATKPAAETLAEIGEAIELTKLKHVSLARELGAARTEAVASGTVGTTSPRVRQLVKKVDDAEARIAELLEDRAIANRLAEQEAEFATRARVDELKIEAEARKAGEAEAWDAARAKFGEFVVATSGWAELAQMEVDTHSAVGHEFANRPELEGLLAALRPYIYPLAVNLGDVIHLLAGEVDTSRASVKTAGGLECVSRTPERPWGSDSSWTTNFS